MLVRLLSVYLTIILLNIFYVSKNVGFDPLHRKELKVSKAVPFDQLDSFSDLRLDSTTSISCPSIPHDTGTRFASFKGPVNTASRFEDSLRKRLKKILQVKPDGSRATPLLGYGQLADETNSKDLPTDQQVTEKLVKNFRDVFGDNKVSESDTDGLLYANKLPVEVASMMGPLERDPKILNTLKVQTESLILCTHLLGIWFSQNEHLILTMGDETLGKLSLVIHEVMAEWSERRSTPSSAQAMSNVAILLISSSMVNEASVSINKTSNLVATIELLVSEWFNPQESEVDCMPSMIDSFSSTFSDSISEKLEFYSSDSIKPAASGVIMQEETREHPFFQLIPSTIAYPLDFQVNKKTQIKSLNIDSTSSTLPISDCVDKDSNSLLKHLSDSLEANLSRKILLTFLTTCVTFIPHDSIESLLQYPADCLHLSIPGHCTTSIFSMDFAVKVITDLSSLMSQVISIIKSIKLVDEVKSNPVKYWNKLTEQAKSTKDSLQIMKFINKRLSLFIKEKCADHDSQLILHDLDELLENVDKQISARLKLANIYVERLVYYEPSRHSPEILQKLFSFFTNYIRSTLDQDSNFLKQQKIKTMSHDGIFAESLHDISELIELIQDITSMSCFDQKISLDKDLGGLTDVFDLKLPISESVLENIAMVENTPPKTNLMSIEEAKKIFNKLKDS